MIDNRLFAQLSWRFPVLTIILAMFVHGLGPNMRAFPFFISESAHPDGPESSIFIVSMLFSGLLLMVASWRIYDNTKQIAVKPKISFAAMLTGVFAGFNLFLVGVFDMYASLELHVITALNLFYASLVWGILVHFGIYGMEHHYSKRRLTYLGIATLCHIVMIYTMSRAALEYSGLEESMIIVDLNPVQHWVRWAATAEFVFLLSFIALLSTYESEISGDISDSEE